MDAAARFLEARPRSVAETRRRLTGAGYPSPLVDEVLVRLGELGYLDDEAFARAWVESRDRAHPRGESALRRELSVKGIASDLVATVLAERRTSGPGDVSGAEVSRAEPSAFEPHRERVAADPDLDGALRLLRRRSAALLREPDERRRRQRAYALLARQGFDPGTCREAVDAWAATSPGDPLASPPDVADV
jgi:SOS response regulatory protein OraA/RecX